MRSKPSGNKSDIKAPSGKVEAKSPPKVESKSPQKVEVKSLPKPDPKGSAKQIPAPPAPAKATFDTKNYTKTGVSEEEVKTIKQAFDLFDTDQGGSIDIKGKDNFIQNSKLP